MCRNPRSAYRHPVRHGIPVTTMVVASPIARRRDQPERMTDRVIPVDAIAQPGDATRGHVELEREEPAGRPRRAEQEPSAVPTHGDAHDPGRQVEEAGKSAQVERRRYRRVASGQEVDRRSRHGRPCRRQLDRGEALGIALAVGRERRAVVGGEVLEDQRMVDRRRPLEPRVARVRAQAVVEPRGVAGSHAAESLIPAGERARSTVHPIPQVSHPVALDQHVGIAQPVLRVGAIERISRSRAPIRTRAWSLATRSGSPTRRATGSSAWIRPTSLSNRIRAQSPWHTAPSAAARASMRVLEGLSWPPCCHPGWSP